MTINEKMAGMSSKVIFALGLVAVTLSLSALSAVLYILHRTHPLDKQIFRASLESLERGEIVVKSHNTRPPFDFREGEKISMYTQGTNQLFKGCVTAVDDGEITIRVDLQQETISYTNLPEIVELTHRSQKVDILHLIFKRLGDRKS